MVVPFGSGRLGLWSAGVDWYGVPVNLGTPYQLCQDESWRKRCGVRSGGRTHSLASGSSRWRSSCWTQRRERAHVPRSCRGGSGPGTAPFSGTSRTRANCSRPPPPPSSPCLKPSPTHRPAKQFTPSLSESSTRSTCTRGSAASSPARRGSPRCCRSSSTSAGRCGRSALPLPSQFTVTSALLHYVIGAAGQNATNSWSPAALGDRQQFLDTEARRWEGLDPRSTHSLAPWPGNCACMTIAPSSSPESTSSSPT